MRSATVFFVEAARPTVFALFHALASLPTRSNHVVLCGERAHPDLLAFLLRGLEDGLRHSFTGALAPTPQQAPRLDLPPEAEVVLLADPAYLACVRADGGTLWAGELAATAVPAGFRRVYALATDPVRLDSNMPAWFEPFGPDVEYPSEVAVLAVAPRAGWLDAVLEAREAGGTTWFRVRDDEDARAEVARAVRAWGYCMLAGAWAG